MICVYRRRVSHAMPKGCFLQPACIYTFGSIGRYHEKKACNALRTDVSSSPTMRARAGTRLPTADVAKYGCDVRSSRRPLRASVVSIGNCSVVYGQYEAS